MAKDRFFESEVAPECKKKRRSWITSQLEMRQMSIKSKRRSKSFESKGNEDNVHKANQREDLSEDCNDDTTMTSEKRPSLRSDVLGSYSSSPSSESASIKYIDEDITTVTDSTTFEHLETSAEIHPVPKAIEPALPVSPNMSQSQHDLLALQSEMQRASEKNIKDSRKKRSILVSTKNRGQGSQNSRPPHMFDLVERHTQTTAAVTPPSSVKLDRDISPSVVHQEQVVHQELQGLNEVLPWASSDGCTLNPEGPIALEPDHRIIHRSNSPISDQSLDSTVKSSMLNPDREHMLSERMHSIVSNFRNRASTVRQRLEETPSPQEDSVLSEELAVFNNDQMNYYKDLDDLNKKVSTGDSSGECYDNKGLIEKIMEKSNSREGASSQASRDPKVPPSVMPNIHPRPNLHAQHHNLDTLERLVFEDFNGSPYTSKSTIVISGWQNIFCNFKLVRRKFEFVDPRGYINIAWLSIQAMVFLYNAFVIPLRYVFPFAETERHLIAWLAMDYFGDLIYVIDMLLYKSRLMFMENGFWVKNKRRLTRKYVTEGTFRYDLAALMPLDFLYFQFGVNATLLRLPRLIKVVAFKEFTNRLENCLTKPYFLRIVKTVVYMLYLIHLNACAYFAISAWEIKHGIVSESEDSRKKFVYDGPTDWTAYIRCFYFATKTATSIGKNKKPHVDNVYEILFMTVSWLMGFFVVSILIGDIRDIVGNARRSALTYQKQLDAITTYMNNNKVAKSVQDRVKKWMDYTWSQQKSFDEHAMLSYLPLKMRTDIAMRVHYSTLGKVKLFRNCEPGLLKDLVVLLRPVIYLPGDYICRKNDIGKEMFIIQSGQVQVLGGIDGRKVLVTLGQGSVFGEIALLGVGGMNRRTADVVSRGFSNLFVLQKDDLETVLKDYADAKRILNARARKLMKENEERTAKEKYEKKVQDDADRRRKNQENMSDDKNIIFSVPSTKSNDSDLSRRDPAILETLMKMLPPSSKVKEYLKHSIPTGLSPPKAPRPTSATAAMSGIRKKAAENIQLDVLHPEFRLLKRSRSFDRSSWTLDNLHARTEGFSGTISNQSKLQRAPPRFLSERTLMSHPSFEDSPPYSLLSDAGSVFNEASPNKQRTKVVIEQNNALIAFSDKKRVDYESIDIVQEARTSKTKKE